MRLRPFESRDADACAQLLYNAVHQLAGRFYTQEQRFAWAPEVMSGGALLFRLDGQVALVAEDIHGVAGFMSYDSAGELDFAYVRPDCAGKGVALRLHDVLLQRARGSGLTLLHTSASELARRFFERRGWKVEVRNEFERHGILIHNYRMSIEL